MLGVRTHSEEHIVTGNKLLLIGVIGCRHVGEAQADILIDRCDLRYGIRPEREDGSLAVGKVLRGLLVCHAFVWLRIRIQSMLLLSSFSPQLAEIGFLLLEFRIVAQRYKGTVQGSQRGLEGPCIRP